MAACARRTTPVDSLASLPVRTATAAVGSQQSGRDAGDGATRIGLANISQKPGQSPAQAVEKLPVVAEIAVVDSCAGIREEGNQARKDASARSTKKRRPDGCAAWQMYTDRRQADGWPGLVDGCLLAIVHRKERADEEQLMPAAEVFSALIVAGRLSLRSYPHRTDQCN